MATFDGITYKEVRENAGEFFRATETGTDIEACELGNKAFFLMYLGLDKSLMSDHELNELDILCNLVTRRSVEFRMRFL